MVEGSDGRNAERLAETRARVLDAVIDSLAERGYAATSTTEVARRSGLTRGAQLHHFGTKERMMIAAVDRLSERTDAEHVARALDAIPDDERIGVALQVLSNLVTGPDPQAYVELWAASRDQAELAVALRTNDEVARDAVRSLFGPAILARSTPRFDELLDLVMYALRGMALDAHLASADDLGLRKEMIVAMAPLLGEALLP